MMKYLTGIRFEHQKANQLKTKKQTTMTRLQFNDAGFKSLGDFVSDMLSDNPLMQPRAFYPRTNITETADDYVLEMLVPGRVKEDFKIALDKNLLTVSFDAKEEVKSEDRKTLSREFSIRSFNRSFTIDEKINIDGIVARYENGVLTLSLPKKEEVKALPKEISIS